MGLDRTKPVFGVSHNARLKPVSLATETGSKNEIWLVAILDLILYKKQIRKALINLQRFAGWSAPLLFAHSKDRFSRIEAHV